MCAGTLLPDRKMYQIYLRLLSAFETRDINAKDRGGMSTHPVEGVEDPTQLVSVPKRYTVRVEPRNEDWLKSVKAV